MVADTKVTWDGDDTRTSDTYANGLAKIVILRHDLAVGVTGYDPHGRIRDLMELREQTTEHILEQLEGDSHARYVIASLDPCKLWVAGGGKLEDRTSIGRAMDGDPYAVELFQRRYNTDWLDASEAASIPFRLMTAMQYLTSFGPVSSVGGFTLRATGGPGDGFSFIPDRMISIPGSELIVFVGAGDTRGAVGMLDPQKGAGPLFTHESPDTAVWIEAASAAEFVRRARELHRQTLTYTS